MSEPEKLYRVVQYDNGALYPVRGRYYSTIRKARERRTNLANVHRKIYGTVYNFEARARIEDPLYRPPIYGIQECELEWGGVE